MAKRKARYGRQRRPRSKPKRKKNSAKANAKKIRSNRKAIRTLQKETRESFIRQFDATFDLIDHGPIPPDEYSSVITEPLRVACLPLMPLLQYDDSVTGLPKNNTSWGITPPDRGLTCREQTSQNGNWSNGQIGTGTKTTWPVSNAVFQFSNNPAISTEDQFSKVRHNGGTLRWKITAYQPITTGITMPLGDNSLPRPFPRARPRPVRVMMIVVSAKKKYADALLRDRHMDPMSWDCAMQNGINLEFWPGGKAVGNTSFGLREGEDYIVGNGLYNKVEMNKKLWNVHSYKTMDFGYRAASGTLASAMYGGPNPDGSTGTTNAIGYEPQVGLAAAAPYQDPVEAQDDGLSRSSNWYKEGSIKLPSYGRMYDLRTTVSGVNGQVLTQKPHDMDKNDVANEKMRFVLFFCNGHGSGSVASPNHYNAAAGSAIQLRMETSWRTGYTCTGGDMLD